MVDQTENFVRGETDADATATDTTLSVVDASEFPDPANGEYNLVFWDDTLGRPDQDDDAEIVRVTGRDTTNDDLTVTRGQESTTAASHPSASVLQLSPTAKTIEDIDAEKADTNRAVEDFSTNGSADTIPVSQGSGSLAMQTLTEGFDSVEVFDADGTFDASGIDNAYIECVGGGGGGGGVVGNGSDTIQIGASGGGGEFAADTVDLSSTTSVSVTVGAGGAANTGGADSSFGTFVVANGGGGSAGDIDGGSQQPGSGGSGGTGSLTIPGQEGALGQSTTDSISDAKAVKNNRGGDSVYGSGGFKAISVGNFGLVTGASGDVYGGGGGGAVAFISSGNSNNLAGGSGAQGIVIVRY